MSSSETDENFDEETLKGENVSDFEDDDSDLDFDEVEDPEDDDEA